MKIKLLLSIVFVAIVNFLEAQTPIQSFDSFPMSTYYIVESPSPIDNSPTGTNAVWTFNSFSATANTNTVQDTYTIPTVGETTQYPNTTSVQVMMPTPAPLAGTVIRDGINSVFTEKNIAGLVSITGIERDSLVLNYNGDNTRTVTPLNPVPPTDTNGNALIGIFPLAFGSTSTDDVSGRFTFYGDPGEIGTLEGDFEGTITASVDAFGTLNTNDFGNGTYSGQVTRLKIEQNLRFSVFKVSADQLSYYYYDASTGNLILRYTKLVISSTGSFVETTEDILIEHLDISTLSIDENNLNTNALNIYPNPVENDLNFSLSKNARIKSIIVSDITGRQVINAKTNTNFVDVSRLKTGIYIMTAITNKGLVSRKFIKE